MQLTHTHTFEPKLDNKIGTRTTNKPLTKSILQPIHPMLNTYIKQQKQLVLVYSSKYGVASICKPFYA